MDTRQLAAFCAVVERRSFSQAAARLGVTQPAVSLQVRSLEIGASTGPAAIVVPLLLCEFKQQNTEVKVELAVSDTQTVVSRVADRELELGIVGAARRHRSVAFEPFFTDEVILACPPGHSFAGRTVKLDELKEGPLVLMQEGAGVRLLIEDELRRKGRRIRELGSGLE